MNVKMCQNKLYLTNIYSVPIICQVIEKVSPFLPTFLHFSPEDTFYTSILFPMLLSHHLPFYCITQNLISKISHILPECVITLPWI